MNAGLRSLVKFSREKGESPEDLRINKWRLHSRFNNIDLEKELWLGLEIRRLFHTGKSSSIKN